MEKMINEVKTTCIFFGGLSIIHIVNSIILLILLSTNKITTETCLSVQSVIIPNQLLILAYMFLRYRIAKHNNKVEEELLYNVRFKK